MPRLGPLTTGIAGGLLLWAIVLALELNPKTDTARFRMPVPGTRLMPSVKGGADLYATSCASCHGDEGQGRHPVFPPLAGSPWITGSPERLVAVSLHGLSGPIQVNGIAYTGLMPSFTHLSDAELAAVLTHTRVSWGNEGSAVTESDVATLRELTQARREPWTVGELDALGVGTP